MNNIYPKCTLCGGNPTNGLYDGIRLYGMFICSGCEQHIIRSENDSMEYQHNIQLIRAFLSSNNCKKQPILNVLSKSYRS